MTTSATPAAPTISELKARVRDVFMDHVARACHPLDKSPTKANYASHLRDAKVLVLEALGADAPKKDVMDSLIRLLSIDADKMREEFERSIPQSIHADIDAIYDKAAAHLLSEHGIPQDESTDTPPDITEDDLGAVKAHIKDVCGAGDMQVWPSAITDWVDGLPIAASITTRWKALVETAISDNHKAEEARIRQIEHEKALRTNPTEVLMAKVGKDMKEVPDLLTADVLNKEWRDPQDAADYARQLGILIVPRELHPSHLADCLTHTGFHFQYNELDQACVIRHGGLKRGDTYIGRMEEHDGWDEVKGSTSSLYPITRARNSIVRCCAHIKKQTNAGAAPTYSIIRMSPRSWGSPSELFQAFKSLKGKEMAVKNELAELADKLMQQLSTMTKDERSALIGELQDVFINIPGLKADHPDIARHAGTYIYTMIGHRILQHHPHFKPGGKHGRDYRPAREMPVLIGHSNIGKTTTCEHIVEHGKDGMKTGKLSFSTDENRMGRYVLGNILMIVNDLTGLKYSTDKTQVVKAFLTEAKISVDRKFLDAQTIPMPSVFIGTAETMVLAPDQGLFKRIIPLRLTKNDDDPAVKDMPSGEDRGKLTIAYFAANRERWIMAGVAAAMANISIEAPPSLMASRRDALARASTTKDRVMIDIIREMLEEKNEAGKPLFVDDKGRTFITSAHVAWKAEQLEYPCDIGLSPTNGMRRGDTIAADATLHKEDISATNDRLRYRHLSMAFVKLTKPKNNVHERIASAMVQVGLTDKDEDGGVVKRRMHGHDKSVAGWVIDTRDGWHKERSPGEDDDLGDC